MAHPTSPRAIQIDPNLPPSGRIVTSPNALSPNRALGSPKRAMTSRSFRDDPEGKELRQALQDRDSAKSMSRLRSGSMTGPEVSPGLNRPSQMHFPTASPIDEGPFPMLSDAEEMEMDRAREGFDGHSHHELDYQVEEEQAARDSVGGSSGYESNARLLRRRASDEDSGPIRHRQGPVRNNFDFGPMEEFAGKDAKDAAWMPQRNTEEVRPSSHDTNIDHEVALPQGELGANQVGFHRRRQRKLSQSNPVLRRGKLALFEGFGAAEEDATPIKAGRQPKALGPDGFAAYTDAAPGHERPYRFSFYSNALPVTIHARSLGELPAEGQTFEELFKGNDPATARPHNPEGTDYGSITTAAAKGPRKTQEDDSEPEAFTWWLDVLSPTDEEMRMLSKVFGIHPLTTEDILLEETREKIELFRNYYLVCFRSFDQDPYSQTYLEPLNMYIIVFREGTLSFHFRGTPHPQNVRRRIKHLKDYISVTSDWISYALIDDITDAFGPLIQSIEYEVDSIDELVLILKEAEQSDMLRRIGTCRKKVMGLLRLMGNKADVVKGLAKRCNEQWLVAPKSDIGLYLSDIQDHLITMTQNLNHYEKILSRSHSNYLAQISIEMTDANNQINDVLSKLTALGTVLIPMNLVTGLWGMNVHVPGQDITDGYAWFGGILGGLALFAILGAWATYKCFVR